VKYLCRLVLAVVMVAFFVGCGTYQNEDELHSLEGKLIKVEERYFNPDIFPEDSKIFSIQIQKLSKKGETLTYGYYVVLPESPEPYLDKNIRLEYRYIYAELFHRYYSAGSGGAIPLDGLGLAISGRIILI